MFDEILALIQVKRYAIVTYKHGIYQLPRKLRNVKDVGTEGKLGNIKKLSKVHRMIA